MLPIRIVFSLKGRLILKNERHFAEKKKVNPQSNYGQLFSALFRGFLLGMLVFASAPAHSADIPKLEALFKETFVSNYRPRFCGENITHLITQAANTKPQAIDLTGASLYFIVGGAWNIQTFAARGLREGGAQPFEEHWILVADGKVFDYDFTDQARVPTLEEYMTEMFIPRSKYVMGNFDPVHELRERLVFTAYDAQAYHKNGKLTQGLTSRAFKAGELVDIDSVIARSKCRSLLGP